ncbi:hypothetical protein MADMEL_233 [Erwinia phage vB_EamM_MadMel]|uniref:Uncharacterized protein n=2 Tax=Agricanvirus TaxID=1984776 RepID=A0A173GFK3_9CAUD|nr:hypothetical protein FDH97_gp235 [Erwinia phage vB_EamM_Deimos-Minion]ANH52335.1 hypothetical protein DM_235 [Erwinia phage vB_EamM_Deimos-Minion]AUG86661.1 hypothetical protein MADMEL_233 [Erwinia phage vB_EamM_MadMel]
MSVMTGGFGAINALMSNGRPTQGALEYFNNQYQGMLQAAQQVGSVAMQQIYQIATHTYENLMQTRPWELAEAALRQTVHMFDPNTVRQLLNLADMQTAKPIMQRWVMAQPDIRQMYHQQRIDGYSETYEDAQPGMVGADHYDYRRAANGMLQFAHTEEVPMASWQATTYYERLVEGDNELSFHEKRDIHVTWDACLNLMNTQAYDPTSIFNMKLA